MRDPQIGDAYLIRKDKNDTAQYYFLQIDEIKGDSITLFHNEFVYPSYKTYMDPSDSFVTSDALIYTRKQIQKMFDAGELNDILRRSKPDSVIKH